MSKIQLCTLFVLFYVSFIFLEDNWVLFSVMNLLFIVLAMNIFKFNLKLENPAIYIALMILSIPVSFMNILGSSYSQLPISWFNIFALITGVYIINSIFNKKVWKFNFISLFSLIILFFGIIGVLNSVHIVEGLKQFLNIVLFFGLLLVWPNLNLRKRDLGVLINIYILSVVGVAISVIVQAFLFRMGFPLGNTQLFGGGRYAVGYLFGDFSFLSIYLITPFFFILWGKQALSTKLILIALLVFASFITTARTGLVSLLVCVMCVLIVYSLKNIIKKTPTIMALWFTLVVGIAAFLKVLSLVRQEGLFSGSGRVEGYWIALEAWGNNPFLGIGLDLTNYSQQYAQVIPHNFFIQTLLQGGLLYLFIITIFLTLVTYWTYKNGYKYFWSFFVIMIGAQFIPDIFESRFLLIVLLLGTITYSIDNNAKNVIKGDLKI